MLKHGKSRAGIHRRSINPPFVFTPDIVSIIPDVLLTITGQDFEVNEVGESDFILIDRQQLFFTGATTFGEAETVGIFQDTLVATGQNILERDTIPITAYAMAITEQDIADPGDVELIAIVIDTLVLTGRTVNEIEGIQVLKDDLTATGQTVNTPTDTDAGSADTVPVVGASKTITPAVGGIATPVDVGSIFVATTGNDANPGTAASPKRTVSNALAACPAGGYVIIRGGTYTTAESLQSSGTASAKKTVRPFQNETAIFDGAGHSAGTIAFQIGADNIRVIGITVRNSKRMGIGTWENTGLEIIGCTSHGNWEGGIWVGGPVGSTNNNLIRACRAFNNMNHNVNGSMSGGGWAVGISLNQSDNSIIEDCYTYESWGEGIDLLTSINCIARNNKVKDHFSVSLYNDNGQTSTWQNNLAIVTSSAFNRSGQGPAYGGVICNENVSRPLPSSNITFNNNRFVGTTQGPSSAPNGANSPVWYSTFGQNSGLINSTITPNEYFSTVAAYTAKYGPLPT